MTRPKNVTYKKAVPGRKRSTSFNSETAKIAAAKSVAKRYLAKQAKQAWDKGAAEVEAKYGSPAFNAWLSSLDVGDDGSPKAFVLWMEKHPTWPEPSPKTAADVLIEEHPEPVEQPVEQLKPTEQFSTYDLIMAEQARNDFYRRVWERSQRISNSPYSHLGFDEDGREQHG